MHGQNSAAGRVMAGRDSGTPGADATPTVLLSPGRDAHLVEDVNRHLEPHGQLAGAADPWKLRYVTGAEWCLPVMPPRLYGGRFRGLRLAILAASVLPVVWRYPEQVQVMWHDGARWHLFGLAGLRAETAPVR